MKFLMKSSCLSAMALLVGCGTTYSYQNVTVTVMPQPISVPAGTSVTFTASVTNAPDGPSWVIVDGANTNAGSLSAGANASSVVYTAPPSPPIYSNLGTSGLKQGQVTVTAILFYCLFSCTDSTGSATFVITAPSITVGVSPQAATVALSASQQFTGYAVGSTNGNITWEVNGIAGGSLASGTITYNGLYTAPAATPMNGNTVTVTTVSQADPSKTASSIVTLQ